MLINQTFAPCKDRGMLFKVERIWLNSRPSQLLVRMCDLDTVMARWLYCRSWGNGFVPHLSTVLSARRHDDIRHHSYGIYVGT